jgi:hypothetical protein
MPSLKKILMISLLLLTACATSTDPQDKTDCGVDFVRILNEDTGRYDCVSQLEWERILDDIDEVRY